ncbi:MAG: hypothetical protein LBH58_13010 [Tannerellaceae bacterium]|jgi:hypothetical protein|nr:hypothetical protein [Tannerellaceae bacterium]
MKFNDNLNKDELHSRREFFKKAAKRTLPVFGFIVFGGSFTACSDPKDDDFWLELEEEEDPGCKDCSASCTGTTKASSGGGTCSECGSTCTAGCRGTSQSVICTGCGSTCSSGCKGTTKTVCGDCTIMCASSCAYGCKSACGGNCVGLCSGTCGGACGFTCTAACRNGAFM